MATKSLRDEDKLRAPLGKMALRIKGMVRRMAITATAKALWSLSGAKSENESDVPVFAGVGFYSRPAAGNDAEVVMLKVGGASDHPVIIATRDERARQAVAAARDLDENETILFNSTGALIHIKKDGSVEVQPKAGEKVFIRRAGGATDELVTKADFLGHGHPTAATGPLSGPVVVPPVVAFGFTPSLEVE